MIIILGIPIKKAQVKEWSNMLVLNWMVKDMDHPSCKGTAF